MKRLLALCLTALLLFSLVPAAAAETAAGTTIRLQDASGTVTVKNASGKAVDVKAGMRLYNGYSVATGSTGGVSISLDGTKAVKLGASASLEVKKSGKKLELSLRSGELFFNVTEPLGSTDQLNIRTATMVTGVRGSYGWVRPGEMGLLHGRVIVSCFGERTGTELVESGHGVRDRAQAGYEVFPLTGGDVPALAAAELAENAALQELIRADVPTLDVDGILASLPEKQAAEAAAREEAEAALAEALEAQAAESSGGAVSQVFEEDDSGSGTAGSGGNSGSGGGSGQAQEKDSFRITLPETGDAFHITVPDTYAPDESASNVYLTDTDGVFAFDLVPDADYAYTVMATVSEGEIEKGLPDDNGVVRCTLTVTSDQSLSFYALAGSAEQLTQALEQGWTDISLNGSGEASEEYISIPAGTELLILEGSWSFAGIGNDGTLIVGMNTSCTVGESGLTGSGSVTVLDGATLTNDGGYCSLSGRLIIAAESDASTGELRVGTLSNEGTLELTGSAAIYGVLENGDAGVLEIMAGAAVSVYDGGMLKNLGQAEVSGTLTAAAPDGGAGGFVGNYGSMTVSGALQNNATVENLGSIQLTGNGTYSGDGKLTGNAVETGP